MAAPIKMGSILWCFACFILAQGFDDEFEGSRTLMLEHSFDQGQNPVFTKRGTVIIRSVQSNRAMFSQNEALSSEDRAALRKLAQEDGIYRVKIPVKEAGEETLYVSTYCKACSLYESSLNDNLIMSVDQSGEVLGLSMAAGTYCQGLTVPNSNLTDWYTKVDISVTVSGPVPETQNYIDKIRKEENEKAKGTQTDNRSFFSKYWMYIVPFLIMVFVMNSMDPQQGQGGGGGGGGR